MQNAWLIIRSSKLKIQEIGLKRAQCIVSPNGPRKKTSTCNPDRTSRTSDLHLVLSLLICSDIRARRRFPQILSMMFHLKSTQIVMNRVAVRRQGLALWDI